MRHVRTTWHTATLAAAAALALAFAVLCAGCTATASTPAGSMRGTVVRVVDGDTAHIRLDDGAIEKVRFIGVDTPESTREIEPYGKEASAYTKRSLDGIQVWLETDAENRDRYGRLLAYIWLDAPPADPTLADVRDKMFNGTLLRDGYGQILTIPPNVRYADQFIVIQRKARDEQRGLWDPAFLSAGEGVEQASVGSGFVGNSNSMKFHRPDCRWGKKVSPTNRMLFATREAAAGAGYKPCGVCRP